MSAAPRGAREMRRADPTLRERVPADTLRPFGIPRALGVLIYSLFSAALVIPRLRQLRRRPSWNLVRLAGAIGALGAAASGGALFYAPAGLLFLAALFLKPSSDPDYERNLQRRLGADYLLNGGAWGGGTLSAAADLAPRTDLYLLLKGPHLLVVPRHGPGEVHCAVRVSDLVEVRVDGERYAPIYVSEAKQPPVREKEVDRHRKSALELRRGDGATLRFIYQGAFSRHLADTAAHAVFSVREQIRARNSAALHVLPG